MVISTVPTMATKVVSWALVAGHVFGLTTEPIDLFPAFALHSSMRLLLNYHDISVPIVDVPVLPLTPESGLNLTDQDRRSFNFKGDFVAVDADNFDSINASDKIVYFSCRQSRSQSGGVNSELNLDTLLLDQPKAIVLYNLDGNGCMINDDGSGQPVLLYSMNDKTQATEALDAVQQAAVRAQVSGDTNITESTNPNDASNDNQGGNSAVAMSILYSITALITLLFLVIIATGAIRAHRYPERYGPREGLGGRPRQSRAKGLARAVLDTLPIVKFEQNQKRQTPVKDPEGDHELQSIPNDRELEANPNPPPLMTPPANQVKDSESVHDVAPDNNSGQTMAPASQGADVSSSSANQDDHVLGCSICTEDFLVGEDVRVLPCDHKFHPQCVDPWLTNVSGTCPLCRLDLRPQDLDGEAQSRSTEEPTLAPPLDSDSIGAPPVPYGRRMSRLFDLNLLRYAPREERIRALRRYASETGDLTRRTPHGASPSNEEEQSRRANLAEGLRERFRIRTTMTMQSPSPPPTQRQSLAAGS